MSVSKPLDVLVPMPRTQQAHAELLDAFRCEKQRRLEHIWTLIKDNEDRLKEACAALEQIPTRIAILRAEHETLKKLEPVSLNEMFYEVKP